MLSTARQANNTVNKYKDLGIETSINGTPLKPDDQAIPCGLIAKSIFTDKFTLMKK